MKEELAIKNMVCDRCIMAVKNELDHLAIDYSAVTLGKVSLIKPISEEQKDVLSANLTKIGFELLADKRGQLVEKVKNLIIDLIHHNKKPLQVNLSDYISKELNMDYSSISKLFSDIESTTIEKFVIAQKIERVKELISYNELNLSEIAIDLHYSSVAHLSSQFKKITGITPSEYKNQLIKNRIPLSDI
ncbi:MAG: AraC family transcriptional regulator [Crocinitomicaceae bacterium]|nr:AraC family transcriptional regulator [Crocinitomicaceae bacterium]